MKTQNINKLVSAFLTEHNVDYSIAEKQDGINFSFPKEHISMEQIQLLQQKISMFDWYSDLHQESHIYILKVRNPRLTSIAEIQTEKKLLLHLLLFLMTFMTMTAAGAYLKGNLFWEGWNQFASGIPYAIALSLILTAHEFGHYFSARYYNVKATLPYYIFFWAPFFNFGTLGAYIKIKSPIPNKKALLNIGLLGPVSGFIVTLIILLVGYHYLPDSEGIRKYYEAIHALGGETEPEVNLILGKSLLIYYINDILAAGRLPMSELYHFPLIFAGWTGLFVTGLNLMPVGQLDGGHITYALFGKRAVFISALTFGLLILLNFISLNYLVWVILIFFIVKFKHPPTLNDSIQLSLPMKLWGFLGYILFALSFIPVPIVVNY